MTDDKTDTDLTISEITEFCPMISPTLSGHGQCDINYVSAPSYMPERGLLSAILERAIRDLGPDIDYVDRISAINWFTGVRAESSKGSRFTFDDVIMFLDLGALELRHINKLVQASKHFESTKVRHTKSIL